MTEVTKIGLEKKYLRGSDSLPRIRLFSDSFYTISGANQRDVRTAIRKQADGHDARNTVNGIFQRNSVQNFQTKHIEDHVAVIGHDAQEE